MSAMASQITSLSHLLGRRSKKTSKLRVTGLCGENSPVTSEFSAQRPVTRKMFPFDDVIMDVWSVWMWSNSFGTGLFFIWNSIKFVLSHLSQTVRKNLCCASTLANNFVEYLNNKIELIRNNLEESLNTSTDQLPVEVFKDYSRSSIYWSIIWMP